jgi:hypothetical protein
MNDSFKKLYANTELKLKTYRRQMEEIRHNALNLYYKPDNTKEQDDKLAIIVDNATSIINDIDSFIN